MTPPRHIEVDPDRLPGWLDRFAASHGALRWSSADTASYLATAADGSWARLTAWQGVDGVPPDLSTWSAPPPSMGLLLLRRGGYALGLSRGARMVSHTCGTRYVQSKTAAGGWSQQRFARRRSNQAGKLVNVAAAKAVDVFAGESPEALVVGGDRALTAQALQHPGLAALLHLPRREFYDIPDPRFAVLQAVAQRASTVRVTVCNVHHPTHLLEGTTT